MAGMPIKFGFAPSKTAKRARVYLREDWVKPWTEQKYLYCDWVVWCANPSIPTAQLSWRFGRGLQQETAEFADYDMLDLIGENPFVKIVIEQEEGADPLNWYGVVEIDEERRHGTVPGAAGDPKRNGEQTFLAYGLLRLIEREEIYSSWVAAYGGIGFDLLRGLEFNRPRRSDLNARDSVANRLVGNEPNGRPAFDTTRTNSGTWSSRDIARYLVKGLNGLAVDPACDKYLPTNDYPRIPTHGRSFKQVLDALMDRRRLLGYVVDPDPDGVDYFRIRPFTYLDEDLEVDGVVWPANDRQWALDIDSAIDAEATLTYQAGQYYDVIKIRGERVVVCGTVIVDVNYTTTHTFGPGWTLNQEETYLWGASAQPGYSALEWGEKTYRNQQARHAHGVDRVYRYYQFDTQWNGKMYDWYSSQWVTAFPWAEFSTRMQGVHEVWYLPEMRLCRSLPLKTDHDYTYDAIAAGTVVDATPTGHNWEYLKPQAWIRVPRISETGGSDAPPSDPSPALAKYMEIDRLAQSDLEFTGEGRGRECSIAMRLQDDAPGVVLTPVGVPAVHYLAGADYTPVADTDEVYQDINYKNLVLTLALEADCYVEVEETADEKTKFPQRTLVINAGKRDGDMACALHYVVPGTVVDCRQGQLYYSTGGVLRDDRPYMRRLAKIAKTWYCQARQTITVSWRGIGEIYPIRVGDLITQVGVGALAEMVRTVVTEIRIDFPTRPGQTERVTLRTGWAELDVLQVL